MGKGDLLRRGQEEGAQQGASGSDRECGREQRREVGEGTPDTDPVCLESPPMVSTETLTQAGPNRAPVCFGRQGLLTN